MGGCFPESPTILTELGPQKINSNHGFGGLNSIIVVYVVPWFIRFRSLVLQ